jgi:hypothetical protein
MRVRSAKPKPKAKSISIGLSQEVIRKIGIFLMVAFKKK